MELKPRLAPRGHTALVWLTFWGLNVRGAARRAISKAAVTKAIAVSTTTVNNVKSVILKVIFNLTTKYYVVKDISFIFFSEGKRTIRYGTLK